MRPATRLRISIIHQVSTGYRRRLTSSNSRRETSRRTLRPSRTRPRRQSSPANLNGSDASGRRTPEPQERPQIRRDPVRRAHRSRGCTLGPELPESSRGLDQPIRQTFACLPWTHLPQLSDRYPFARKGFVEIPSERGVPTRGPCPMAQVTVDPRGSLEAERATRSFTSTALGSYCALDTIHVGRDETLDGVGGAASLLPADRGTGSGSSEIQDFGSRR